MASAISTKERILLVDDEIFVLETLEHILSEEGYEVTLALNGKEAIEKMDRVHFDLILTDLKMEGVNGLEVLAHAQNLWPRPVTILLTGYASLESAVEALNRGAYSYLTKPCGVEALKLSIRQGLERKRLSEVEALYQTARTLISQSDLDQILTKVLQEASRVTGFSRSLFILYREKGVQVVTAGEGSGEKKKAWADAVAAFFKEDKGVLQRLEKGETLYISRPENIKEKNILDRLQVKALLAAPLIYQGRLCGVLYLDNDQNLRNFTRGDTHLALGLADMTAMAIQNADLVDALRRTNQGLLDTKAALEEANRELKSLDQLKTDLLSNVSHELKTPMVAVKGYTNLVLKGKAGPVTPLQQEYLGISLENLQKQLNLIDHLLDFSKLGNNGTAFPQEPFDLAEVLGESLQVIRPKADEKEIEIDSRVGARPCMVIGNRTNIGHVFNNLLSNAVKFTSERGKIAVNFRKQKNEWVKVTVTDTGIGIPAETQQKIFDRFYQVESSKARRYGGIGLGLAIAQDIIKRHGGEIKVISQAGRGAEFTFSLRLADFADAASEGEGIRRNDEDRGKRKRKINLGCG